WASAASFSPRQRTAAHLAGIGGADQAQAPQGAQKSRAKTSPHARAADAILRTRLAASSHDGARKIALARLRGATTEQATLRTLRGRVDRRGRCSAGLDCFASGKTQVLAIAPRSDLHADGCAVDQAGGKHEAGQP